MEDPSEREPSNSALSLSPYVWAAYTRRKSPYWSQTPINILSSWAHLGCNYTTYWFHGVAAMGWHRISSLHHQCGQSEKSERPFKVEVDALDTGVGAMLPQHFGESQKMHPIAFFPRKITSTKRNYDVESRATGSQTSARGVETVTGRIQTPLHSPHWSEELGSMHH